MEAKVFSTDGKEVRSIELNDEVFGHKVSNGCIYYAINNELANRRVGTACTKTRAEVNYSNTKPYKQKGTGNARQGDKKSPLLVGGGTIFGPRPREYGWVLPKKMKRLAMKSLLTLGVKENRLVVVEDFTAANGKTKELISILKAFNPDETRTLVVLKGNDALLRRAARNIPYVHVQAYDKLSAHELLYGRKILVLETAAKNLNDFYGETKEAAK
ncbi:MAG: 50S ribosomal protein L4 [Sphaerochaeta sp.]|jgi:large subunit ribosomal protein L4|nr:50S ribosomal protein L4 [Sphaerochaeta sp.]MCH3920348.1 50S ribosomal protein L4 [Sphaerochaeta sp.]MCI2045064.1 50S ribosomal protein L4 [Sphaerochaeta sp.]MCI2076127.1 50S ribosomal protein L4 [Sphaerochaeta sp.]MCI2096834.1 50S ribosomal protein L4 [Sphaerochaeta sp.]